MPQNRLNLNFELENRIDRANYARDYLNSLKFELNETELDTIAKYILWGKDEKTGLNGRQEGLELETAHKTWDPHTPESLDRLVETPGFSEIMVRKTTEPPTRISREVFSRSKARREAPPHILAELERLWTQIDETELTLNFYELRTGKRTNPPRPQLLKRIEPARAMSLQHISNNLTSFQYIKLKRELVELRRDQYTYKDEYAPLYQVAPTFNYRSETGKTFGAGIDVLPIGIPSTQPIFLKIFNPDRFPNPTDFDETELRELSKILWTPAHSSSDTSKNYFDFSNPDHLYELFSMWEVLEDESDPEIEPLESTLSLFLRAALMYRTLAGLDPIQSDILDLKIKKKSNQEIADIINKKFEKNYRPNYISTLYCKKCLGLIANAALLHREVLENCFFPENFKQCKDCGQIFLLNEQNFVRRHRSADGFSPRCKQCEKKLRAKN